MKRKWLDAVLIVVTLMGGISFMRVQSQLAELHREQARIVAAVGTLKITDPQVMHIKALDAKEPWQWAWRVYMPDKTNGTMNYSVGTNSASGSLGFGYSQQEFIARVSLNQVKNGSLGLHTRVMGSASFSTFGSKEFGDFLWEHRSELKVERAGDLEIEQLKAGDPPILFFRLSLPEELARQAKQKFSDLSDSTLIPVVLEVKLELP